MPSSTKPKNETSNEVQDPLKQALSLVEKKVRNLEKRKLKLDMYKLKLAEGAVLEKDQLEAVNKYNDVSCNLEFAKELLKQFMALTQDAEKLMKRQMKKERAERILNEHKRLKQVLLIQNMFDNFEIEQVRNDFRNGWHSAVVLTEENLTQLDNLWKLISPESRENEKEFTSASEHLCNLLDAREKAILGTTYKELKELIDLILNCGYFENAPRYEKTNGSPQETSLANKAEETKPSEEPVSTVTSDVKSPETSPVPEEPESINVEIEKKQQQQHQQQQVEPVLPAKEAHETNNNNNVGTTDNNIDGDSFFSTGTSFPRQRPFQEIVSSVQGSFNFLQESTIDLESPQHLDPAVVIAHPMPTVRHPQTQSEVNVNTLAQTGYANTGYDQPPPPPSVAVPQPPKPQQPVVQTNASMHPVPQPVPQMPAPQANIVPQQTAQPPQTAVPMDVTPVDQQQSHAATILNTLTGTVVSQPQLDYTNQTCSQNAISQNLPNDSLFHSVEDGPAPIALMGQPVNDTTVSQFEIPAIPMPNQTQLQDGGINPYVKDTSQSQGVKKFTNLNANAAVFQSMNANAAVFQPQHTDTSTDGKGQLSPQATDYNQGGSYSTSYFPRGTFPNRNFRGNRGRGGLNNGFNRNSNSGGSGGGSGGGGGGNRTGYTNRSSYPSFPSREYRPADNYSMLNGASFGNGFPKRSSSGPGSTGGNAGTVTRGTTGSGGGGGGSSSGGGGGGSLKSGPGIASGASPSQTTYWTNFAVRGQPRGGSIRGGRGTGGGLGRATFPQQPLAQQ